MNTYLPGIPEEMERLKSEQRLRELAPPRGVDFSSNDYLGLSRHPALREAVMEAIDQDGMIGAGGSRLLRGHHPAHARLEEFAADFFASEKALFFGSGFLANFALFSTFLERHDAVIFDEHIHASVKEGIHASPAVRYRARHNDTDSFESCIRRARDKGARRLFVAVESVYSMDGDLAPLNELHGMARDSQATLVVDEAHATGVFGAHGRGLGENLLDENCIGVHTCGKALGVAGALICASADIIDFLINKARPFIYSTAPPPFLAAAVQRSLRLIDEEPWRRERVQKLAKFARDKLSATVMAQDGGSQIIPIQLGEEDRTLKTARALQDAGFDVRAIRPPTVPDGTSRLRVSIHADRTEAEILALANALRSAMASP
ncbi:MAG TPA: 8-amino-7-oxononanoate synthase [Micropepsaceae bacterium]|nr:8-amino-7-oxononanoate synthase [Micropepsaceae bacterium]